MIELPKQMSIEKIVALDISEELEEKMLKEVERLEKCLLLLRSCLL